MMLKFFFLLLFSITPLFAMAKTIDSPPPNDRTKADYILYVGGIRLATATLDVSASSDRYFAESSVVTSSFISVFIKSTITSSVIGYVNDNGSLSPLIYESRTLKNDENQALRMVYENNRPKEVKADPPMTRSAFELTPVSQYQTLDPLSAILSVFLPRKDKKLCDRTAVIYDGKRRYEVRLSDAEDFKKPGTRKLSKNAYFTQCKGVYERIAGYKPSMMEGKHHYDFDIWFETFPDKSSRIIRISGDTLLGQAIVRLKD